MRKNCVHDYLTNEPYLMEQLKVKWLLEKIIFTSIQYY